MQSPVTHFQFTYNLALINVEKKKAGDEECYTLQFSNEVPTVTLQALKLPGGIYKWDTIPAGIQNWQTRWGS